MKKEKFKKNPAVVRTCVSDNEMINDVLKGFNSYQDFDKLLNYVRTLNDNVISRLETACNNKKKVLNQDIDTLLRDPKWKKDNDITNLNLNENGVNKLNRICDFKNRTQWVKLAIKQVREEREKAIIKDKEERRIKIVEQSLDKFENYIESTTMEPEKNIELPACPMKCDRSPLKKRTKNKILNISTG